MRTYNNAQEAYMVAKANLEVAEQVQAAAERIYIIKRGIVNPDGTTPEKLYMIRDKEKFETACAEYDEITEHKEIWELILEAREILKDAERNLLDYALNVVPIPENERAVLKDAIKTDYTTRQKVIVLVMSLDASTIPV